MGTVIDLLCDHCGVVVGPYRSDDTKRIEAGRQRHLDSVVAAGEDPSEHTFTEEIMT